jgi:hypothetical protein
LVLVVLPVMVLVGLTTAGLETILFSRALLATAAVEALRAAGLKRQTMVLLAVAAVAGQETK